MDPCSETPRSRVFSVFLVLSYVGSLLLWSWFRVHEGTVFFYAIALTIKYKQTDSEKLSFVPPGPTHRTTAPRPRGAKPGNRNPAADSEEAAPCVIPDSNPQVAPPRSTFLSDAPLRSKLQRGPSRSPRVPPGPSGGNWVTQPWRAMEAMRVS